MSAGGKPLTGRRILVVEDDYFAASELSFALLRHGALISGPWPDSREAIGAIDGTADSLDAAILDIELRDGDASYPIAAYLDRVGVPYLFSSASTRREIAPEYRDRPYVPKPATEAAIIKAIGQLLQ